jgi:integrase
MANNPTRNSVVAAYIDGLLAEKRANGYDYISEELVLNRFDKYCIDHRLETPEITKAFLSTWMEQTSTEGAFNQGKRISVVRQLVLFMATCDVSVYIPHDFCHFTRALPHIFDSMELIEFFDVLDSYAPSSYRTIEVRMHMEYRILFRLYCCCGLRNSEAASIECSNVDFENGVLTILDSKGNKDRLVYLADDLKENLSEYYAYLFNRLKISSKWLFPGLDPKKHIPNTTVNSVFNRFWEKTIYASCHNKPTVHDFRFTFVVNRMNIWAESGIDLDVMMPYLSRYLGHKSINETFYYYYLVKDAYKTVSAKDTIANDVIPEVRSYE